MKNTISPLFLIFFELCVTANVFSLYSRADTIPAPSDFLTVLDDSHIWNVCESDSYSPRTYCWRYKMGHLTQRQNGKTYKNVLISRDSIGHQWSETSIFVREEEGRVWVLDTTLFQEEVLWMDMNLEKDDSFVIETGYDKNRQLRVYHTDTITDLTGVMRKIIYLNCAEEEYYMLRWIEGIGSDIGVFDAHMGFCLIDFPINNLFCFYSEDIHYWQVEYIEDCWKTTVKTQNNQKNQIWAVFPNPGHGLLSIVTSSTDHENIEIRIVDGMGATVLVKTDDSPTVLLDVDFLPIGIYTIFISGPGNKKLYHKWIKS